jgi:hypothetical protein
MTLTGTILPFGGQISFGDAEIIEMTGGVALLTMTLNVVGVAALPAASLAKHVTVVVPIANVDPDTGTQVAIPFPSTVSVVIGARDATVAPLGPVAVAVTSACAAITGAVVSLTMTLKVVGVAALPAASLAVHVTVVVPIANVDPDPGAQVAIPFPSTASVVPGAV